MFTDEERKVFPLKHRGETIHLDPDRIHRARMHAEPDDDALDATIAAAFKDMSEVADEFKRKILLDFVYPAQERLAEVARATFGWQELQADGSGVTDAEAVSALDQFFAWAADLKKDTPDSSESPSTTDAPADSAAP